MIPPPCCPDGRVRNACAAALYRRTVEESYPLGGSWRGWRIQGNKLIGPHGARFTPQTLAAAFIAYAQPAQGRLESSSAGANGRQPARIGLVRAVAQFALGALRQMRIRPNRRSF